MFGFHNNKGGGEVHVIGERGTTIIPTKQCVHCGTHHEIIPGSGRRRGFCSLCKGFVCGADACMKECVPFEARIDFTEAISDGRARNEKVARKILSKYPAIKTL